MTDEEIETLIGPAEPEKEAVQENRFKLVTSAVNAPTIFADGCLFGVNTGSTVRLTFAETIFEPADAATPGMKTRHVGTLVMPLEGFRATLDYLNHLAKDWFVEGAEQEQADGE